MSSANAWEAGFIGFNVSIGLYSLTIAQTVHYFQCYHREDKTRLKLLVLVLFALDTFHMYAVAHTFWIYFINGRRDASLLDSLPWQLIASLMTTYLITFIVQIFYGIRVYKVTRRNRLVFGMICIISLVQIAAGTAFVAEEVISDEPTIIVKNTATLMLEVTSTVVCDLVITCATVWGLRTGRIGMDATDKLLHRLVIYAINMGLIGCLVALVQLIVFAAHRNQMLFLGANFVVSKCYSNSLLATLNARHPIREAHDEWVDDENTQGIVLHRLDITNPLSRLASRRSGKNFDLKEIQRFMKQQTPAAMTRQDFEHYEPRKRSDSANEVLKSYEIDAKMFEGGRAAEAR